MLLVLGAALAADPVLDGVPGAHQVTIERGDRWVVRVGPRTFEVPAPTTEEERQELRALVVSVLVELELVPEPPPVVVAGRDPLAEALLRSLDPAPRSPAPARVPAPSAQMGRHAELAVPMPQVLEVEEDSLFHPLVPQAPSARADVPVRWFVGPRAVVRARIAPGPGLLLGAATGARRGLRAQVEWVPPRATRFGPDSTVAEAAVEGGAWQRTGPVRWLVGVGLVARRYEQAREVRRRHVAGRATGGVGVPWVVGPIVLEPRVGLARDLVTTEIGPPGERVALSPWALHVSLTVGPIP